MSKRFNRDDVDKFHDYGIYLPSRTIYMGSEAHDEEGESGVDGLLAERFVKNLTILNLTSKEPIKIILNNPGGDWYHGIAIYDSIKNSPSPIRIEVLGMAMSMGGVILQASTERFIAKNAKFMMHYGTMGMGEVHAKTFEKWSEESKRLNIVMEQIFLERIHERNPDFKLKELRKMLDFDTILTAEETVALGLADGILGEDKK